MRRLLAALPVVALVAAAADTLCVRERLRHRELDPALFLQALLIWLVFAFLALAPAHWWLARREKSGRKIDAGTSAATLAFVTIAPVLVHWRLDAFSDLGGSIAGLKTVRPWLEVAGVIAALLCVLFFLKYLAARWRAMGIGVGFAIASTALGLFANPWHEQADSSDHSAAGKPNLLLLIWDTTRAQSLSLYGYDRKTTPNLERLASESIVFDMARSASRYTLTSHLSMLTGVYPSQHGARMTRQRITPHDTPSIAATLREHGYRTAAFVGTGVLTAPTGVSYGFEHFDDQVDPPVCDTHAWALVHDLQSVVASLGPPFSQNGQPHWFQDFFRPANEVLANAAKWIGDGDKRPWFCMINLYDAHWPYRPDANATAKWVKPYNGPVDGFHMRSDHYPRGYKMQAGDDQHLRELYDAELSELDVAVDHFLETLELSKNNTAVLMCADHGEAFGEGGKYEHGDILEPQVHVPFLVRMPGAYHETARRVSVPISGVDVAPTLLALAGIAAPAQYAGVDVLSLVDPAKIPSRSILVEDRDQMDSTDVRLALYDGTWKLVRRGLGNKQHFQLFDLKTDPIGLTDVLEQQPELAKRMEAELVELRARWHADDKKDQEGTGFANLGALKGLGYTGK